MKTSKTFKAPKPTKTPIPQPQNAHVTCQRSRDERMRFLFVEIG